MYENKFNSPFDVALALRKENLFVQIISRLRLYPRWDQLIVVVTTDFLKTATKQHQRVKMMQLTFCTLFILIYSKKAVQSGLLRRERSSEMTICFCLQGI